MIVGVYVSGYSSGAGKSTTCMFIVSQLLRLLPPSKIVYVKPVTQCEATTDVVKFCEARGVTAVGLGPVVFRSGITTETIMAPDFLERRKLLLQSVIEEVTALANGKLAVVDGVGYPSVGSCCGVGGREVAKALNLPVLISGPPGVGDAIDTVELMRSYYTSGGCNIAGVLFNKLKDTERHKVIDSIPVLRRYFSAEGPAPLPIFGFIRLWTDSRRDPKDAALSAEYFGKQEEGAEAETSQDNSTVKLAAFAEGLEENVLASFLDSLISKVDAVPAVQ